jgi:cytochrome b
MAQTERVKVWDFAVRIFHWSLVLIFITAFSTGDDESQIHILAGYGILGLVVFRFIWGFIGSKYARFWNFIYRPRHILAYMRSLLSGNPIYFTGHNPLGGMMVIALLVSLIMTAWTGIELEASADRGLLANKTHVINTVFVEDSHEPNNKHEGDEDWEELHEFLANLTLVLVLLHISGVIAGSVLHRENLIKAMISGVKPKQHINHEKQ